MTYAEDTLLDRDKFRKECLARDKYTCVWCGKSSSSEVDMAVHHIMERRLFPDGGYYRGNGATLCHQCHWLAEDTSVSPQQLRDKIGIKKIILPEHFYPEDTYDKWGNIVLPNGTRVKGELYEDEGAQAALSRFNPVFSDHVKYPRTYHLPWSEKVGKDDKTLKDTSHFEGKDVVVTLKMDGENASLYQDYYHARSLDSRNHPSRNWLKNFHAEIRHNIPKGFRICGENLYAKHTIYYPNLKSYFYGFSIWDEINRAFDWDLTLEWFELLGIVPVPTIYRGPFNREDIHRAFLKSQEDQPQEGYVVRLSGTLFYSTFRTSVAKFVSKQFNIDQKKKHWFFNTQIAINQLGEKNP